MRWETEGTVAHLVPSLMRLNMWNTGVDDLTTMYRDEAAYRASLAELSNRLTSSSVTAAATPLRKRVAGKP